MRKLNISIDDVSPHHLSSIDVVDQCFRIIEEFPEAKFTLFVPTAYWRTMPGGKVDTRTKSPLYLKEHPDFCRRLAELPKENFEVGFHGRHHGIQGQSNNDELRYLNGMQVIDLFSYMKYDVHEAGLTDVFKPILRPPAMYMSADAIEWLGSGQIVKVLALSQMPHHKKCYGGADESATNVVYANVWPPNSYLKDAPEDEHIEALYHACTWDGGYLSEQAADDIITWLRENQVEFAFIEDLLDKSDSAVHAD